MSNQTPDIWRSVRELATRSLDEQAKLWRDYADLWKPSAPEAAPAASASPDGTVTTGSTTSSTTSSTSTSSTTDALRVLGEETTRLVRDYAQLTTRYYQSIFDLGRSYAESVAGQILGVRDLSSSGANSAPARPAATDGVGSIVLEAAAGDVATSTFIVENHRGTPLDVDLQVSSFTGPGGAFDADVTVLPNGFALAPGEERRVTLSVKVKPEQFTGVGRYRATLVNRLDPDTRLVVEVRALELVTRPPAG